MELNYFDVVVGLIILFLGLKGVINGFFKEVFGLIGIIGGIFIASRFGDITGQYLSNTIFKFESSSAISFSGFLATLILFWLLMVIVGSIFKKLSHISGLGPIDKLFGFVLGSSKFFLITAVIAHSAYNIQALKTSIEPLVENSILFPILTTAGAYIMKIDPVEMGNDINISINKQVTNAQEKIEETLNKSTQEIVQKVKEDLIDGAKH